jgi:hypothetical protein
MHKQIISGYKAKKRVGITDQAEILKMIRQISSKSANRVEVKPSTDTYSLALPYGNVVMYYNGRAFTFEASPKEWQFASKREAEQRLCKLRESGSVSDRVYITR